MRNRYVRYDYVLFLQNGGVDKLILTLLLFVLLFLELIVIHELGHALAFALCGARIRFKFEGFDPTVLVSRVSTENARLGLLSGVTWGYVILAILPYYIEIKYCLVIVALYLIGTIYDVRQINKLNSIIEI